MTVQTHLQQAIDSVQGVQVSLSQFELETQNQQVYSSNWAIC
ncbi:hypothetical protein OSK18_27810 [Escherichia coli]|nr:hypothetical protein [Escherichia coli]